VRFNAALKTSASGKYLIAVLDADNAVTEVNELNNIVVSEPILSTAQAKLTAQNLIAALFCEKRGR
jgi:hypothetical protein